MHIKRFRVLGLVTFSEERHVLKPGTPEHRNTGTPEHHGTPEHRNTTEHRNTPEHHGTPPEHPGTPNLTVSQTFGKPFPGAMPTQLMRAQIQ